MRCQYKNIKKFTLNEHIKSNEKTIRKKDQLPSNSPVAHYLITSTPPIYGRNTSGMITDPSSC